MSGNQCNLMSKLKIVEEVKLIGLTESQLGAHPTRGYRITHENFSFYMHVSRARTPGVPPEFSAEVAKSANKHLHKLNSH